MSDEKDYDNYYISRQKRFATEIEKADNAIDNANPYGRAAEGESINNEKINLHFEELHKEELAKTLEYCFSCDSYHYEKRCPFCGPEPTARECDEIERRILEGTGEIKNPRGLLDNEKIDEEKYKGSGHEKIYYPDPVVQEIRDAITEIEKEGYDIVEIRVFCSTCGEAIEEDHFKICKNPFPFGFPP